MGDIEDDTAANPEFGGESASGGCLRDLPEANRKYEHGITTC